MSHVDHRHEQNQTAIHSILFFVTRRSSLAKVLKKGKLAPLNKEEDHVKGSSISPSTLPKIQHQERPEPLGRAQPQFGSDQESEEEDEDEDDESDGDGRMRNAVLL